MTSPVPGDHAALARLLNPVEPLPPDESPAGALARLRAAGTDALAVVEEGQVLGVVGERELLAALALRPQPGLTCRALMRHPVTLSESAPPHDAAHLLTQDGTELVVVTGADGRYAGVVTRRLLLTSAHIEQRPLRLSGLATPFGVHLTDGHHRGGASDFGLVLGGAYLTLVVLLAAALTAVLAAVCSRDPQQALLAQLADSLVARGAVPGPSAALALLPVPLFLWLLRLSTVAGYHSGEHQTVHAVERGLPLEPAIVAQMPRPHVRCGTNFVVLATSLGLLCSVAQGELPWPVALVALALMARWRRVGAWVQEHCTTRPAAPHQLGSGIQAARALLREYRRHPERRANRFMRLWNRGLLQMLLGVGLTGWAADGLTRALASLIIGR